MNYAYPKMQGYPKTIMDILNHLRISINELWKMNIGYP